MKKHFPYIVALIILVVAGMTLKTAIKNGEHVQATSGIPVQDTGYIAIDTTSWIADHSRIPNLERNK